MQDLALSARVSGGRQVIKANDDLTPEHHQFFLYQMLRGLKYIHTGACMAQLENATCNLRSGAPLA